MKKKKKKTVVFTVGHLHQGGFVNLPSGEKFEYLLAEFGVKVPSRELTLGLGSPQRSPQRTAGVTRTRNSPVGKASR